MNKNLIKKIALNITKDDIINFGNKENIEINEEELDLLYQLIKKDIDIILDCDFYEYIKNYKNSFNDDLYNKILEKYNKYKSFIE